MKPTLEFVLTTADITGIGALSTLLVFNNEVGFSKRNIDSLCGIGRSTKKGQRHQGFIGEKGKHIFYKYWKISMNISGANLLMLMLIEGMVFHV